NWATINVSTSQSPSEEWVTAYLGLGANVGDPQKSLTQALRELAKHPKIKITKASSLYHTAPVGLVDQPDFLNGVVQIETALPPDALMTTVLEIEKNLGRVRTIRWGPRVIDIDVLLYGMRQIETSLITAPHPRMHERAFVMTPLAEIAPYLIIPGDTKNAAQIASEISDEISI
ncbi:MAG: FolK, partial [Capsulimonas sp.]|nr:FolK [Capsulimonas sp.]